MSQQTEMTDVLVVGAGPTGLTAAIDALRHGLRVRVVERRASRSPHSKALVLHARTMEVLELLGCAPALLAAGQRFKALNVRTATGAKPVRVDLIDRRWGDTRYPFWLSVPQYETERILEERLIALGGSIEWSTELTRLEDRGDEVVVTLNSSTGTTEHRARWVLGCDGGRSATREQLGVPFRRDAVGVTFALCDVTTDCALVEDEGHVTLAEGGLLLIVPMPAPHVWRLIAQIPAGTALPDAAAWNALVLERAQVDLKVKALGWNTSFELTSGVADAFRKGRVFLLGDAAHVHSPVGGQGLNTGVQDAHNLVWKLALLRHPELAGANGEALLDTYQTERQPTARAMVQGTARATRALTLRNPVARWLLRRVASVVLRTGRIQDRLGRGVGMLDLLTAGQPRLPNPQLPDGSRLHDRVDPLAPTLLTFEGRELLVRPDRVVAPAGSLPPLKHAAA